VEAFRHWLHAHAPWFGGAALGLLFVVALNSAERLKRHRAEILVLVFALLALAWGMGETMYVRCTPDMPCN
jgi:uncharacterized membrane protein AbrB (regulator of aidB expression)